MTEFKGFATMEAAKQFVKERGNGLICWDKKTKSGKTYKDSGILLVRCLCWT